MNMTFKREFLAFTILAEPCTKKVLILLLITSFFAVIHSSKNSIHYGGQAAGYLEPSRTSTVEHNDSKLLTVFAIYPHGISLTGS